jgi:hypothetical protein
MVEVAKDPWERTESGGRRKWRVGVTMTNRVMGK